MRVCRLWIDLCVEEQFEFCFLMLPLASEAALILKSKLHIPLAIPSTEWDCCELNVQYFAHMTAKNIAPDSIIGFLNDSLNNQFTK